MDSLSLVTPQQIVCVQLLQCVCVCLSLFTHFDSHLSNSKCCSVRSWPSVFSLLILDYFVYSSSSLTFVYHVTGADMNQHSLQGISHIPFNRKTIDSFIPIHSLVHLISSLYMHMFWIYFWPAMLKYTFDSSTHFAIHLICLAVPKCRFDTKYYRVFAQAHIN